MSASGQPILPLQGWVYHRGSPELGWWAARRSQLLLTATLDRVYSINHSIPDEIGDHAVLLAERFGLDASNLRRSPRCSARRRAEAADRIATRGAGRGLRYLPSLRGPGGHLPTASATGNVARRPQAVKRARQGRSNALIEPLRWSRRCLLVRPGTVISAAGLPPQPHAQARCGK